MHMRLIDGVMQRILKKDGKPQDWKPILHCCKDEFQDTICRTAPSKMSGTLIRIQKYHRRQYAYASQHMQLIWCLKGRLGPEELRVSGPQVQTISYTQAVHRSRTHTPTQAYSARTVATSFITHRTAIYFYLFKEKVLRSYLNENPHLRNTNTRPLQSKNSYTGNKRHSIQNISSLTHSKIRKSAFKPFRRDAP